MYRTHRKGFTFVEVMVVVTLVTILATAVIMNMSSARSQSRDVKRQSDMRIIQSALEIYKQRHGRYPEGCNSPGVWSGQPGTSHACSDGSARFIVGAPGRYFVPDFISSLPQDPRLDGADSGYVYSINPGDAGFSVAEGNVYKLVALNTVETEEVNYQHEFTRCGARSLNGNITLGAHECSSVPTGPTGGGASIAAICSNAQVSNNANDYAVVGGFSDGQTPQAREYYSDLIRCK